MARVKNNKQATNVAREYIKDMNKNKVASIILLLFLVVFLFNLLKFNRKVPVGKDEIEMNKKNKTKDLVWFTYVTRKPEYGVWTYKVFDAKSREIVGELTLKLKCGDWVWK